MAERSCPLKSNNTITGTRSFLAMCSMVSNDGAFLPRSIKLRKSTEIPTNSANLSWDIFRSSRIVRSRCPNSFLSVGIQED